MAFRVPAMPLTCTFLAQGPAGTFTDAGLGTIPCNLAYGKRIYRDATSSFLAAATAPQLIIPDGTPVYTPYGPTALGYGVQVTYADGDVQYFFVISCQRVGNGFANAHMICELELADGLYLPTNNPWG